MRKTKKSIANHAPYTQIDIDKFVALTGLAPGSAKNAWYALRKKLTGSGGSAPGTPKMGTNGVSSASVLKKSPVVKKRGRRIMTAATDIADEEEDDVADEESPCKKTKPTKDKGKGKAVGKSTDSAEAVVKAEPEE